MEALLEQLTTAIQNFQGGSSPIFPRFEDNDNFSDFIIQFEGLCTMHNYSDDKFKASFLALLSPKTFQLLKTLVYPDNLEAKTYQQLKAKLSEHLKPTPLTIPSRFALHTRKQREGESVTDYMTAIRALAIPCAYSSVVLKEVLKDVFVAGLRSRSILDRLFIEDDGADFDKLYKLAIAVEKAEESTQKVLGGTSTPVNHVETNKKSSRDRPNKKFSQKDSSTSSTKKKHVQSCSACGKDNHQLADCRIKDKISCNFCNIKGHLSSCCRKKMSASQTHNVHNVNSGQPAWHATVNIEKQPFKFELDSGCSVTILPEKLYLPLASQVPLKPTTDIFVPYGDSASSIHPLGHAIVSVEYQGISTKLPLYVVKGDSVPLMGRHWLQSLNILQPVHRVDVESSGSVEDLHSEFPDVFQPGIGCAHETVSIKLLPDAVPVFRKSRSVPWALKEKISKEIDEFVAAGILEPVDSSQWATPIVPVIRKNSIRICADYSCTINPVLDVPQYPLPRAEELLSKIGQATCFAKLDIRKAYLCLPLDEISSKIMTINTHKGLFEPKRLMFGCASAPVVWTKFIEKVTANIEGLAVYFDDLCVAAPDKKTLYTRLRQVLRRLQDHGLRVNGDKCCFFAPSIDYLGYTISADGIRPQQDSIQNILKVPPPKSVSEIKSFMGMISFYSKFFPNMATTAAPLYKLTQKDTKFHWSKQCDVAFKQLKSLITSDRLIVPYDPDRPIVLSADAGPTGVGAVLAHEYADGSERPILYIHRALSKTQQAYSQLDKEAYAIKWATEKLHHYLIGRSFVLYTDHRPLLYIFGHQRRKLPVLCATRLLHYALFLQEFTFTIRYRKAEDHGNADFLSRLPKDSSELPALGDDEAEIDALHIHHISVLPMSAEELAAATLQDQEGRELIKKLRDGESLGKSEDGFFSLESGCVLRGLRSFIPVKYRSAVLEELHSGHLGMAKMKALARNYVFWSGIDSDIEDLCRSCRECALHKGQPIKVDKHYWEYPSKPWERIHVDFAFYGSLTYFLIVDAHSKWPEIFIVPNMNTKTVIAIADELFSRFGYPLSLVSDNQSTFVSKDFREYLAARNIKLITIPPYHAASNGQAERMVGALKTCLRTLNNSSSSNPKERLLNFLSAYRRAPQATTGVSPALLFLKRELTSPLSFFQPGPPTRIRKRQDKTFVDPQLHEGERVAVRDLRNPLHKWKLGTVISRDGHLEYTVLVEGEVHRKHIEHLRRVSDHVTPSVSVPPVVTPLVIPAVNTNQSVDTTPSANVPNSPLPGPSVASSPVPPSPQPTTPAPAVTERPRRNRRPPARFGDYV